eukprot:scaffold23975_cov132-Cylindrotheca_fusiformis.AAC.2
MVFPLPRVVLSSLNPGISGSLRRLNTNTDPSKICFRSSKTNHSSGTMQCRRLLWFLLVSTSVLAPIECFTLLGPSDDTSPSLHPNNLNPILRTCDRRQFLQIVPSTAAAVAVAAPLTGTFFLAVPPATARVPGSKDVVASIQQIQDAAKDLKLLEDNYSTEYAVIDAEGRAESTDAARRLLGGIAPQAGTAAMDAAQNTPLYRIDVAFVTVRKTVLDDDEMEWTQKLDLDRFEELADRIIYATQKADGNFYSVLFAMKGTTMIEDIFKETKQLIHQSIVDLEEMIQLLKDAGAPGIQ